MRRLLEFFSPTNYQLQLTINREEEIIDGEIIITGTPHASIFYLHAKTLDISTAQLISGGDVTSLDYSLDTDADELQLVLPDEQSLEQETTIKLVWRTTLNHDMQSCYLSTYQHEDREERIVATQFESHYARECFPCVDEPAAKATFDLTLIISDLTKGDVVLANTELVSQKGQCFTFVTTPRMSTYLLAWTIGKFHSVKTTNKNGIKCTTYGTLAHSTSSLEFANECAARVLEYYDTKFGLKYPLAKLDQVALPDFDAGAMENWGLVTYRESMMLVASDATLFTKQIVALTVTHELSHQWFGDLVTMEWWDDLWLNESFASIMEYYCTDALYPDFQIWQKFFTSDCVSALRRDAIPGVQSVHQEVNSPAEIATLFDSAIVYSKGARLVLMLIRLMTPGQFDQGLRDYFVKHQYQNTVGDDLWNALQPYAEFDVKAFMDSWISQPGFPSISHIRLADGVQNNTPLVGPTNQQTPFSIGGPVDQKKTWPLPVIFDDMSGHYLLNWSASEFTERLARFDDLSLEQKLRLLIDRSLLSKTPAVPSVSLFDLLPKFATETSGAVWSIVTDLIVNLKTFCPPESENELNFQSYLRTLLAARFAEISLSALGDPDALKLREILLGLALYSKDVNTTERLSDLYQPDLNTLDSELRSPILVAKLRADEDAVFDHYLTSYRNTSDPELKADLLYVLAGQVRKPTHLETMLNLLEQPAIVRPQDHFYLFIYLLRNPYANAKTFDWLLSHWDYVEQMAGDKTIESYPRAVASIIRTTAEAEKFFNFFNKHQDDPALGRAINMAHTEIDARLALIADDTAAVTAKLAELVKA